MIYTTPTGIPGSEQPQSAWFDLADVAAVVITENCPVFRTDTDAPQAEPLFVTPKAVAVTLKGSTQPVAQLFDDPRENGRPDASDFLASWQWFVKQRNEPFRATLTEQAGVTSEEDAEPDARDEELCRQNPALRLANYVWNHRKELEKVDIDLVVKARAIRNLARAGKLG